MINIYELINEANSALEDDNSSFEVLLDYLNKIVNLLESDEVELSNSVNLYVLGVKLGKKLKVILDNNESLVLKEMKTLEENDIKNIIEDNSFDDIPF